MNHCYFCEKPLDRAPYNGQNWHEACKQEAIAATIAARPPIHPNLRDFWTKPADEQARLSGEYGEPPKPLSDEEKQEMEGCGA